MFTFHPHLEHITSIHLLIAMHQMMFLPNRFFLLSLLVWVSLNVISLLCVAWQRWGRCKRERLLPHAFRTAGVVQGARGDGTSCSLVPQSWDVRANYCHPITICVAQILLSRWKSYTRVCLGNCSHSTLASSPRSGWGTVTTGYGWRCRGRWSDVRI